MPFESGSHACDFLLVRNSNSGPILRRFGAMARFMCSLPHPYSTLILGCSRCPTSPILRSASAWVGLLSYLAVSYFRRIPTYVITVPDRYRQMDRRTDRQTTCNLITALCLCVASRALFYSSVKCTGAPKYPY